MRRCPEGSKKETPANDKLIEMVLEVYTAPNPPQCDLKQKGTGKKMGNKIKEQTAD